MSSDSEPYGLNEVDDFMKNKEKIRFDNSTLSNKYKNGRREEHDEDEDYSDEEVMEIDEESSASENEEQEAASDEDESDDESEKLDGAAVYKKLFGKKLRAVDDIEEMDEDDTNWGSTKSNYYGADNVSGDEDDAKAMEEEAKKQQQQHMESLNMMDFMDLDDDEEQNNWDRNAKEYDNKAFEGGEELTQIKKQDFQSLASFTESEKQEFLKTKFPEFIPLFKEYRSLNEKLEVLDDKLNVLKDFENQELFTVLNIKKTAILSNLASINLYFMILLQNLQEPDNEEFKNMKYHPIMEKILLTKEIIRQTDLLPEIQASNDEHSVNEDEEVEEMDENFLADAALDEEEEEEEEQDKISGEVESEIESSVSESDTGVELKSRIQDFKKNDNKGDFVESEINDLDREEKAQKKKSLRFYTAKIDRSDRHNADKLIGGDDDIPYKERMFERKQRLIEEAKKRGMEQADSFSALNDAEDANVNEVNEINNYNSEEIEDFYKSINKNKNDKKQNRMQAHLLAKQATTEGKLEELKEVLDEDGKRAINYQILKNKGLTPHRNKDNRNSRVKKRKKYEKAQKKLRSIRQVYKGPHNGRYEGEKSGIRKDITKSVKL